MKCCLKTKNGCLKTQTKHPLTLSLFFFFFSKIGFWDSNLHQDQNSPKSDSNYQGTNVSVLDWSRFKGFQMGISKWNNLIL